MPRSTVAIALLCFLPLAGCNVIRKAIPGYAPDQSAPDRSLPDELTLTGVTTFDVQWVQPVPCAGRAVTVRVLRPNETEWDTGNEFEAHVSTTGPGGGGVRFGRICYPTYNAAGKLLYLYVTGQPYAPKGTRYEIRSVALTAEHSLY
jgi:hypothetical protein